MPSDEAGYDPGRVLHGGSTTKSGGTMTDRFRGQNLDSEYPYENEDEYGSQDQMSSAYGEPSMQQEQGGPAPEPEDDFASGEGEYSGHDEYGYGLDEDMQARHGHEDDAYETDARDDDPSGHW